MARARAQGRGSQGPGAKRGTGKRTRGEGVLERRSVASPAPESAAGADAPDFSAIEEWAGYGLREAQVIEFLNIPPALAEAHRGAIQSAFRSGRARGLAAIRKAQYEAALAGRVTAQSHVADLLEEGEDEGGPEPFLLVRSILTPDGPDPSSTSVTSLAL